MFMNLDLEQVHQVKYKKTSFMLTISNFMVLPLVQVQISIKNGKVSLKLEARVV